MEAGEDFEARENWKLAVQEAAGLFKKLLSYSRSFKAS
jgi:hypothetical protein